jgi:aminoglycoside phosphotransferase (APT) family kinase protein
MLVHALVPALFEACGGPDRLRNLTWFRSEWQRGGGSTAFAVYIHEDGAEMPVVIKLPVGFNEQQWTRRLADLQRLDNTPITPRVVACGTQLGGHDLAWLVIERLPGRPLAAGLDEGAIRDMLMAAARLQQLCGRLEPASGAERAKGVDFEKMIERSREAVKRSTLLTPHDAQVWNNELRTVHKALPMLLNKWEHRPHVDWCHGDLHAGNAMRRADGSVVLIDLAMLHSGHWIEDALYFERVCWGRPEALRGINAVKELALHRRELGLNCDGDYGMLASVRRVLAAACAPALIEREGNRVYLDAALEMIRRHLPMAAH